MLKLKSFSYNLFLNFSSLKVRWFFIVFLPLVRKGERVFRENLESESEGDSRELSEENGNGYKKWLRRR